MDRHMIGRLTEDWHRIDRDWRIGNGLVMDWRWIGRLATEWQICNGLAMDWRLIDVIRVNRNEIGTELAQDWHLIDFGLAMDCHKIGIRLALD